MIGDMRCVQCGYMEDKVIDSRTSKDGTCIRRRRECLRCQYRYTTYEQIERTELRVMKRDNVHEALNREKILRGMIKACEKRPVSMDQLDNAADEIVAELHRDHQREVPSSIIGMKVIEKLQAIDHIARAGLSVARTEQYIDDLLRQGSKKPPQTNIDHFLKSVTQTLTRIQKCGISAISERRETDRQIVLTITIPK